MIQNTGIEISANVNNIPILVKFIGNSMLKFSLDDYKQLHVQMAVEEAVTIIIKHANLQKSDKIGIKCFRNNNEIEIIIEYPGECFNPIEVPNSGTKLLKHNSGIYKVHFIKKYTNKVNHDFIDGKNILTLIKCV